MAATIKQSPRGGLYRDALRPQAWGWRVGETLEGHAILSRGPAIDPEIFVVPVARLRRKFRTKAAKAMRTLKERRNGWSRGEHAEMNWFSGAE